MDPIIWEEEEEEQQQEQEQELKHYKQNERITVNKEARRNVCKKITGETTTNKNPRSKAHVFLCEGKKEMYISIIFL